MNDVQLQQAAEAILAGSRISLFPGVAFDVTDERELPAAAAWLASWVRRVLDQAASAGDTEAWLFKGAYPIEAAR